jgi:uncharacterized protein DUF992
VIRAAISLQLGDFDMNNKCNLMIGAALLGALAMSAPAQADRSGVKVGVLTCGVASGWGFVLGSSKNLHCTFRENDRRPVHYAGSISKYGVDIGYTKGGVLIWGVFAPTSDVRPGALNGDYVGASASATVGIGAGANVLIGGFDKSIDLQPLSVSGNRGLNVAAGIGSISLKLER